MTVDIGFGKLITQSEDGYTWQSCVFPGVEKEDDGTSEEFTCFPGKPIRSFATSGFYQWMRDVKKADRLIEATGRPGSNDFHSCPLSDDIMGMIDKLPIKPSQSALNNDRHKWFKYWSKRAKEEFGKDAVIAFW